MTTFSTPLRIILFSICLACFTFGCTGSAENKLPDVKPMPGGIKINGKWFSKQFEHMYLRQVGDSVRGIYTYKYGGTLQGKLNGNLLVFDWIDPGNAKTATRTRKGKGYFQFGIDKDGNATLTGKWGYNDSRQDGGLWAAEWVRDLDGEDPRNLEQWREKEVR